MPGEISRCLAIAHLIEKLLTSDLSFAEKKKLDNWLREKEENRNVMQRLYKIASEKKLPQCWNNATTDAAWKVFAGKYLSINKTAE